MRRGEETLITGQCAYLVRPPATIVLDRRVGVAMANGPTLAFSVRRRHRAPNQPVRSRLGGALNDTKSMICDCRLRRKQSESAREVL
jgi:hypothetical protein